MPLPIAQLISIMGCDITTAERYAVHVDEALTLGNMLPSASVDNLKYGLGTDTKPRAKNSHADSASGVQAANFDDLILRQFTAPMGFSTGHHLWKPAAKMLVAHWKASSCGGIFEVLGVGGGVQMRRITAWRVIAGVTGHERAGVNAHADAHCNPVGRVVLPADAKPTVSVGPSVSDPWPAFIWTALVNAGVKYCQPLRRQVRDWSTIFQAHVISFQIASGQGCVAFAAPPGPLLF